MGIYQRRLHQAILLGIGGSVERFG